MTHFQRVASHRLQPTDGRLPIAELRALAINFEGRGLVEQRCSQT
jgi:hypothetical protein